MNPAPDPEMDVYARPQRLVRINRRRHLNLNITGTGAPTIILSAGGGCTTFHWGRVQPPLSRSNRVVAFDRAGLGFSDPGPLPRTTSRIVDDLRAALRATDIGPPYVVVGHSMGAFDCRLFAMRHPEEVIGLVLVDPRGDRLVERLRAAAPSQASQIDDQIPALWRRAVIAAGKPEPGSPDYAALVPGPEPALTTAVNDALRDAYLRPSTWRTGASEGDSLNRLTSCELAAAGGSLGDLPLIVLTAGGRSGGRRSPFVGATPAEDEALATMWTDMHEELARESTRGVRRDVPGVGHMIPLERPAVVVGAIEEVAAFA